MAHFILTCRDNVGALDVRMQTRAAHLAYLAGFADNVKLAGPLLDGIDGAMIGSHFILSFETLEQVEAFAANDPYALAGLFARCEIVPYTIKIGAFTT
jgi:uncharacterized protein